MLLETLLENRCDPIKCPVFVRSRAPLVTAFIWQQHSASSIRIDFHVWTCVYPDLIVKGAQFLPPADFPLRKLDIPIPPRGGGLGERLLRGDCWTDEFASPHPIAGSGPVCTSLPGLDCEGGGVFPASRSPPPALKLDDNPPLGGRVSKKVLVGLVCHPPFAGGMQGEDYRLHRCTGVQRFFWFPHTLFILILFSQPFLWAGLHNVHTQ